MKKKILSKKLNLNKSIVSNFQARQVKGGGTHGCPPNETLACERTRTCDPEPDWTEIKSGQPLGE